MKQKDSQVEKEFRVIIKVTPEYIKNVRLNMSH